MIFMFVLFIIFVYHHNYFYKSFVVILFVFYRINYINL